MKTFEEERAEVRRRLANLVRVICEAEDATKLLFHLLLKRHHDGLNGRLWDSTEHLHHEREVARLIAYYANQDGQLVSSMSTSESLPTLTPKPSTPHYYFCEGVAAVVAMPVGLSSEGWGRIHKSFMALAAATLSPEVLRFACVECYRIYPSRQHGGVYWDEELCGGGAAYLILRMRENSDQEIEACTKHLRDTQDAVRIRSLTPTRWVEDEMIEVVKQEEAVRITVSETAKIGRS